MAQKTYTPEVEAYLDAELAAARRTAAMAERSPGVWVSESSDRAVLARLRDLIASVVGDNLGVILVALLPAVVLGAQYALPLVPLPAPVTDWLPWVNSGLILAAAVLTLVVVVWPASQLVRWRRSRHYPFVKSLIRLYWFALVPLGSLIFLAVRDSTTSVWLLVALVTLPVPLFIVWGVSRRFLWELIAVRGVRSSEPPAPASDMTRLNDRITQLQQMRDWLKDDHLRGMMDDVIGRQVVKSERRQVFYTVVASILSLVAGWLLSAISPVSALAELVQH